MCLVRGQNDVIRRFPPQAASPSWTLFGGFVRHQNGLGGANVRCTCPCPKCLYGHSCVSQYSQIFHLRSIDRRLATDHMLHRCATGWVAKQKKIEGKRNKKKSTTRQFSRRGCFWKMSGSERAELGTLLPPGLWALGTIFVPAPGMLGETS